MRGQAAGPAAAEPSSSAEVTRLTELQHLGLLVQLVEARCELALLRNEASLMRAELEVPSPMPPPGTAQTTTSGNTPPPARPAAKPAATTKEPSRRRAAAAKVVRARTPPRSKVDAGRMATPPRVLRAATPPRSGKGKGKGPAPGRKAAQGKENRYDKFALNF